MVLKKSDDELIDRTYYGELMQCFKFYDQDDFENRYCTEKDSNFVIIDTILAVKLVKRFHY